MDRAPELAVLRLPGTALPHLQLGMSSALRVGQLVIELIRGTELLARKLAATSFKP